MAQSSHNSVKDPTYVTDILANVLQIEEFNDLRIRDLLRNPKFKVLLTGLEKETLELDKTNIEKREILRDIITKRWTFDDFHAFLNVLADFHRHIKKALEKKLGEERSVSHRRAPAPLNLKPVPTHRPSPGHRGSPRNLKPVPMPTYSTGYFGVPGVLQTGPHSYGYLPAYSAGYFGVPGVLQKGPHSYGYLLKSCQKVPDVPCRATASAEVYQSEAVERYSMNTSPRGMAVVINNQEFTDMRYRQGSDKDKESLSKLFTYLDFKAFFANNMNTLAMLSLLKKFAADDRLKTVSSIIVVILTHGMDNEVFFGSDGRVVSNKKGSEHKNEPVDGTYITKAQLLKIFNSTGCPHMKGKPKGFFLQACRGDVEDLQETVKETSDRLLSDAPQQEETDQPSPRQSPLKNRSSRKTEPDIADFIFVYPSTSGYRAYRNPETGSPFITSLTSIIQKYASRYHFEDILKKQRQEFKSPLPNAAFMMPEDTSNLDKHWYFNPPHPHV